MWTCEKCGEQIEDQFDACWKCANGGREIAPEKASRETVEIDIPLVTTETVAGYRVVESTGVASGEAVAAIDVLANLASNIQDFIGGRSDTYERTLQNARVTALSRLAVEVKALGGNAAVGVKLDYEAVRDRWLMVSATGTAVKLTEERKP